MALRVYDTLRAAKLDFEPVTPPRVGVYFCGMTVQDKPHVGHMLAFVAGDVVRRYLEYKGFEVTYVQNFTDIDDKIIARAQEEGIDYRKVADRNIAAYFQAADALNIKRATVYPKATEHIGEIIGLIKTLAEKGHAYQAGGDVYYRVRTFPDYGKLSKRDLDALKSGARIEVGEYKEDPLDFALWKRSREPEPGWESPWGRGRPGWHIECSAMSMKYLGHTLDFHGGGEDLIFPHHENELAQSEGATGKQFVRFWLHNGLLNLKGEKMSKSTGHFFAMDDVLQRYPGEVVRFYLLSTHFRSQSEYSPQRLEEAGKSLERLRMACISLDEGLDRLGDSPGVSTPAGKVLREAVGEGRRRFLGAMDDDFNTARALGHLFELVRVYNRLKDEMGKVLVKDRMALESMRKTIAECDQVLGIFRRFPGLEEVPAEVIEMVRERELARKRRDYEKADALRAEVQRAGYVVEDTPGGTRVRRKGAGGRG